MLITAQSGSLQTCNKKPPPKQGPWLVLPGDGSDQEVVLHLQVTRSVIDDGHQIFALIDEGMAITVLDFEVVHASHFYNLNIFF